MHWSPLICHSTRSIAFLPPFYRSTSSRLLSVSDWRREECFGLRLGKALESGTIAKWLRFGGKSRSRRYPVAPLLPRPYSRGGEGKIRPSAQGHTISRDITEGNIPPGLVNAPDGWNPEQIRQFQEWFDALLAGNTAGRARLIWGPAGAKYQAFKEAPYKDDFDEWLARIVCYAFSLPPTAFTRQVNRATAETAQQAGLEEGLAPLMGWVKRLADDVIQRRMGHTDLEFAWSDLRPIDPKEQAEILQIYVKEGIKTRNEARDALGDGPLPGGDALMVDTAQGPAGLVPQTGTNPAAAVFGKFNVNPDKPPH